MFKRMRQRIPRSSVLWKMLAFLLIGVLLPVMLLNFIYQNLTYRDMQQQAIHSFTSLNRQVVVNLDAILEGVGLYTVYPYYNTLLQQMLTKDYTTAQGKGEVTGDFRSYQSVVHSQVMRYNSNICSSLLYNARSDTSFVGGYDISAGLRNEILENMKEPGSDEAHRNVVVRLVHSVSPLSGETTYYVQVARHLYNTNTREYVGFFCLLVPHGALGTIFEQEGELKGIRQYLIDDQRLIVYSPDATQVGKSLLELPEGQREALESNTPEGYRSVTLGASRAILTRDTLQSAPWDVAGIIDETSLFSSLHQRQVLWMALFLTIVMISVLVVSLVSVSVSRPVYRLNSAMREIVQSHDFATRVPVRGRDEIGELAQSFNRLLEEIQLLLTQVVQREQEKRSAEYKALQAQVNPHFLGNTLNTIKWMANMQCAGNISEAVDSLIHLMNYALDTDRRVVSVEEELAFTKQYVNLMELRYLGAFDLSYDIDEAVLHCQSIRFMLQPLVDNAIFHGLQNNDRRNMLRISAHRVGETLEFHVWDNGVGIEADIIAQILRGERKKERGFNSIGVYNVVERLRVRFGEAYGVQIHSELGAYTDVKVVIPALPIQGRGDDDADTLGGR